MILGGETGVHKALATRLWASPGFSCCNGYWYYGAAAVGGLRDEVVGSRRGAVAPYRRHGTELLVNEVRNGECQYRLGWQGEGLPTDYQSAGLFADSALHRQRPQETPRSLLLTKNVSPPTGPTQAPVPPERVPISGGGVVGTTGMVPLGIAADALAGLAHQEAFDPVAYVEDLRREAQREVEGVRRPDHNALVVPPCGFCQRLLGDSKLALQVSVIAPQVAERLLLEPCTGAGCPRQHDLEIRAALKRILFKTPTKTEPTGVYVVPPTVVLEAPPVRTANVSHAAEAFQGTSPKSACVESGLAEELPVPTVVKYTAHPDKLGNLPPGTKPQWNMVDGTQALRPNIDRLDIARVRGQYQRLLDEATARLFIISPMTESVEAGRLLRLADIFVRAAMSPVISKAIDCRSRFHDAELRLLCVIWSGSVQAWEPIEDTEFRFRDELRVLPRAAAGDGLPSPGAKPCHDYNRPTGCHKVHCQFRHVCSISNCNGTHPRTAHPPP